MVGGIASLVLLTACGTDSSSPASADEIRSRTLDHYDTLERARERCDAVGEQHEDVTLRDDELALLDAAPQCDLQRLGVAERNDRFEQQAIPAAKLANEPTFALCSCSRLEASNRIMAPGQSDVVGDLGANDEAFASAPIRVNGAVISGGTARFDNAFEAGELRVDGTLTAANEVTVSGDAVLGGLDIPGERVNVGGTLTVPDGTDLSSVESAGDVVYESVRVPEPCDCSADVDYDALRERFRDVDGDGKDDFDGRDDADFVTDGDGYPYPPPPYLLRDLSQDHVVYLACGSYYFDGIDSSAGLTLVAVGDVDVFVDGDVQVAGPLAIQLDDHASLNFYVAGAFKPTNRVNLGNSDEPDALRIFARDSARFAGPLELAGTLFAPRARVIADNTFDDRGAVFASSFDFAAPLAVRDGPRFTHDACLVWDEKDDKVEQ